MCSNTLWSQKINFSFQLLLPFQIFSKINLFSPSFELSECVFIYTTAHGEGTRLAAKIGTEFLISDQAIDAPNSHIFAINYCMLLFTIIFTTCNLVHFSTVWFKPRHLKQGNAYLNTGIPTIQSTVLHYSTTWIPIHFPNSKTFVCTFSLELSQFLPSSYQ